MVPYRDSRKSFYRKAFVVEDVRRETLISYTPPVTYVEDGKVVVLGTWSNTTTRHIKEFLYQEGFTVVNSKQVLEDYGKTS